MEKTNKTPFDYVDMEKYLKEEFSIILGESDRGSLLLCHSILENELEKQFKKLIPKELSEDKDFSNKKILSNNFSQNLNKALLCRYIPYRVYKAIELLRTIRNKISHNTISFKLMDCRKEISEISELSAQGGSYHFSKISIDILLQDLISKVINNEDITTMKTPNDVLEYLNKNDKYLNDIEHRALKVELALSTLILIASLNFHFEEALNILNTDMTISSIRK